MGFWTEIRDAVQQVAVIGGNFVIPGSSILTSKISSKHSQENLNSDIGKVAQLGSSVAGLYDVAGTSVFGNVMGGAPATAPGGGIPIAQQGSTAAMAPESQVWVNGMGAPAMTAQQAGISAGGANVGVSGTSLTGSGIASGAPATDGGLLTWKSLTPAEKMMASGFAVQAAAIPVGMYEAKKQREYEEKKRKEEIDRENRRLANLNFNQQALYNTPQQVLQPTGLISQPRLV